MKEKMSSGEMKKILDKIAREYDEYSREHGESFFSKKAFKERYIEAIRRRMDLQAFAYAEIAFLEELKEKWARQQEERRIKTEKPFTRKIEKYIDELETRWRKYPSLFSEAEIPDEAQYFCGALGHFYNYYWLDLGSLINRNNVSELKEYNDLTDSIQKFILSVKNKVPYQVENYIFNLNSYGIEKAHMLFLKEGAGLLKKIKKILKKVKDKLVLDTEPSDEEYRDEEELAVKEKTLSKIADIAEQIIEDFRFINLM